MGCMVVWGGKFLLNLILFLVNHSLNNDERKNVISAFNQFLFLGVAGGSNELKSD